VSLQSTPPDPDPATPRESLARQAYLAVREGIILGRYPQGSRLTEQRLAEELRVSRVPLREAVPQLEMHGFVRTFPRRGAVVTTWDARRVNDLFDLRLCLETGAARLAAARVAGGASMEPLDAALRYAHDVVHEGDAYRIADASSQYHEAIVDLAGNELMSTLMRSVSERTLWLFYLTSQLDAGEAFEDHSALCEAIRAGDQRMAESLAYTHIERDRRPSFAALGSIHD
jgi:DNA-binding GntR family transcriptional regulator